MRKLTIVVGFGAFPVTIVGDPEIEDEVPRPSRVLEVADNLDVACPFGLWRVCFPPFLELTRGSFNGLWASGATARHAERIPLFALKVARA